MRLRSSPIGHTAQTTMDHMQVSIEGSLENSDNTDIDDNVTAPEDYILR